MAQGLGRGLGSLIPKKTVPYGQNPFQPDESDSGISIKQEVVHDSDRILKINPNKIDNLH